jgi:hypothetical protein
MTITLERVELPTETLGSLYDENHELLCKTMELPWKENIHSISCIPYGEYDVIREATSNGHQYPHFRVLNVPGRTGILFHKITYVKDLKGCVGIGGAFQDLNGDGVPDMVQSTVALQSLYDKMPDKFRLKIIKKPQ